MSVLDEIKQYSLQYEKDVRSLADRLRDQQMPEPTEKLFAEFETCGNRLRYEKIYFGRRKFLSVFGLASVIWHQKEDIRKLEEVMIGICSERCWALPAHVNRKTDPNWSRTIDLFASETAQSLAHLTVLLAGELSEEVTALVRREVSARVLTPFMESEVPYNWEQLYNNWNAVCCGNVGSTGLLLLPDGQEKEILLSRITQGLTQYYLGSFGMDGACQEGLGYWVYGFTYLTLFALGLKEHDPSRDLMKLPKTREIALFQQKCYFEGGRTVSFSDGDSHGIYPMGLTCCLADQYDGIRFPDPACAQKLDGDACWRWIPIYWNWYWTNRYLADVDAGKVLPPQRTKQEGAAYLEDAQWCILRGPHHSAVIAKGGNNGESHNHNDVGSFYYLADGEAFLDDLGAGEYTKDYFSDKRYEIFCNRGKSHNIPIINGIDQKAGEKYRSDRFEFDEKQDISISFARAYGLDSVKSLFRSIHLDQDTGDLTVTDQILCDPSDEIIENLVTRLPVELLDGQAVIRGSRSSAVLTAEGAAENFRLEEVEHSNHSGEPETIRVISWPVERKDGKCQSTIHLCVNKNMA